MTDNNTTISIQLPEKAWDYVLKVLVQRPYSEVAPLIGAIQEQAQEQMVPVQLESPEETDSPE